MVEEKGEEKDNSLQYNNTSTCSAKKTPPSAGKPTWRMARGRRTLQIQRKKKKEERKKKKKKKKDWA